jgi:hypothetical protein
LSRRGNAQALIRLNDDEFLLRIGGDAENITGLAYSMPGDTPPGEVKGRVMVGDSTFDALVDVQIRSAIELEPPAIELKGSAGETATATLNVTNRGNTALEYDADELVTLREAGSLARSTIAAFKQRDRDFADRLISLGENMKTAPHHDLAVSGSMATTTLNIGAHTTVTLELGIPEALDPNTNWTGSLALLGARVRVNIETVPTR